MVAHYRYSKHYVPPSGPARVRAKISKAFKLGMRSPAIRVLGFCLLMAFVWLAFFVAKQSGVEGLKSAFLFEGRSKIAFTHLPVVTDDKKISLSYEMWGGRGEKTIKARLIPSISVPDQKIEPEEIPLATMNFWHIKKEDVRDLTSSSLAGLPVEIQLVAKDDAGREILSDKASIVLPEREFLHPVARALSEERKKLMRQPDRLIRHEAANIMAGIARQPEEYRGDPVVLMALRSGAVRLVLDHSEETVTAVGNLLWKAALRIEEKAIKVAG